LQVAPWQGAGIRLALLLTSALCALAILALVPRHAVESGRGRRSLTVYLMHGFLIRGLLAVGAFTWLAHVLPAPADVAACVAVGVLMAGVLSTRIAERLAFPLTRPIAGIRALTRLAPFAIRRRMEEFKRLY
jgi:fucose 4-O-acetylase-like acetyltransferase